jgi:GNAT superfamily N-acetyltransferase
MIRPAKTEEAAVLTQLSLESKGYWRYPKKYFDTWVAELTINVAYIKKNDVYVCQNNGLIAGYYAIIQLDKDLIVSGIRIEKGYWLEHMFVAPRYIGSGIGTKMFDHLRTKCETKGINKLKIIADPNARGFYEKMGCHYLEEFPSTIAGRTTPFLVLIT